MSINAIEKALWQVLDSPDALQHFRDDPQTYLRSFRLDAAEHEMVTSWDVGRMDDHGVSTLLMMTVFAKINGRERMPEYQRKIRRKA